MPLEGTPNGSIQLSTRRLTCLSGVEELDSDGVGEGVGGVLFDIGIGIGSVLSLLNLSNRFIQMRKRIPPVIIPSVVLKSEPETKIKE